MNWEIKEVDLGPLDFPKLGFWLLHAVAIAGIYYWGRKSAQT